MYVDREKALEQGEKLNVVGGPAWRTGFPHETVCCHEGRGGHFCPEISRQACWRAKMPTPARRAAYCWVRKTSAECRATKYWRYFSIAKELSLSKYTSFPWFYWIRDFVTLQNTVFLIAKSGKEIKFLSPYARRKRKKLGTQKQLQEGKRCCKVTKTIALLSAMIRQEMARYFQDELWGGFTSHIFIREGGAVNLVLVCCSKLGGYGVS